MKSRPKKSEALTAATDRASSEATQVTKQGFNVSDSKALTVAGITVRQMNGLYSLNDLHKASGGEEKHQPAFFARREETQALIAEICSADSQIKALETVRGRGKAQGTYACKELVIAYAAWISAAFHLKVIRVFLSVAAPQSAPYSVQPGQTLSEEQAATLRNMLHDGVKKLPKAEQGNAMVIGWSKLKAHFNVGYRQIPAAEFHEALSIVARHLAAWQVHSFEPTPRLRDLERANKGLQRMVEQLHSALGQALSVGRSLQSAASQSFQAELEG